jgi:hypothetical protein
VKRVRPPRILEEFVMRKSVFGTIALLLALLGLLTIGDGTAYAQQKKDDRPPKKDDRKTQRFQGVDFNVNVQQMETMLETAKTSRDRTLKDLAKRILDEGVVKVTGAHSGGFGGGGRPADPEQHCTVESKKRSKYHVYLKEKSGKMSITKITGP